ncbi:hypothetical protein [Halostagnicola sp. A-GB9-2]|uniref:hypothetical protein n=1 Tax=Halostagnicola sp. A-GB9-2 TaxID=3048066 RepID=UPI0024BFFCD4|nr:hypothetical protein [Halostagnicola sp. A-GB9-2]MDJ1433546.1 hypothetical protein [Halostagnicola sp. A-GB9-2]
MNDLPQTDDELREWVKENRDMLVRILRHGTDGYARACAWALLDRGASDPELEQIENELDALRQQREANA